MKFGEKELCGKALLDQFDLYARKAYFTRNDKQMDTIARDHTWYLWCGKYSPIFGKKKMTTFERYFLTEKETHTEEKNSFYKLNDNEEVVRKILAEFELNPDISHIVNGHVPVKVKTGESPIKANGKLLVIDGGMSKAYQKVTGISGYTLIYNSYGLVLVAHQAFETTSKAIEDETDILSNITYLEPNPRRKTVADTDNGKFLRQQITDLEMLLAAYRKGLIKEIR